ncbi:MAG TPA: DUF4388 domain-containing protein [Anaeromyxobacteraceae bacterium]|nr:DUF4388 domain-containing protein [Anaeromyxobacteraceae bacterium]
MARRPLALRFLAGRNPGALVPLDPARPVVLGRQPGVELQLDEELVSRRHARLSFEGDELIVEDLGSTNGTWLNGARITRAVVSEGDRILVGGCLMRVVPRDQAAAEPPAPTASTRSATAMQGRLEEVPLPDLLQLFATSRKSGVLAIQAQGRAAEISLERGRVTSCVIDGRTEHGAEKSFYRLLSWTGGHFELRPAALPPSSEGTATLGASLEALLMEGMRQIDELKRLRTMIPARLVPAGPPPPDLEEEDRALLALAMRLGQRDAVLDATPLADLPAAERLARLLQRGFLRGG